MDYGYHSSLGRAVMMHISAENSMINSRQGCLDLINQRVRNLDQRVDKQTFLDLFNQPFLQPKEFEFQPHRGDEVRKLDQHQLCPPTCHGQTNLLYFYFIIYYARNSLLFLLS